MGQLNEQQVKTARSIGVLEEEEELSTAALMNVSIMLPENAIPVSDRLGEIFAERWQQVLTFYKPFHDDWQKAIEVYRDTGTYEDYANSHVAKENYVRWTVQSLLDNTYKQNPTAAFSSSNDDNQPTCEALSSVVTTLVNRATGLGVNLRPFMQKVILMGYFSNFGVLKLDYTEPQGSYEDVMLLYAKAQETVQKAKDLEELKTARALLARLYDELQLKKQTGPKLKLVSSFNFFVDPECQLDDLSDAKYTIELEYIPEMVLKTQYMSYEEETGRWFLKYNPEVQYVSSIISNADTEAAQKDALIRSIMPDETSEARKVLVTDRVPCLWIHDKTTRRIYLYIKDRWDTPIWVFEDNMKLSQFYPYFVLSYSPAVRGILRYSEVSYLIGMQEEANSTNKQWAFLRSVAFTTFVYNASVIDKQEVDKLFKEALEGKHAYTGIGMKLRDNETDLTKAFHPLVLPIAQAQPLLDNSRYVDAISRASRVSPAIRGEQFRTNTNSTAVEAYQTQSLAMLNSYIDPIEEMAARIMYSLAELIVSKIDKKNLQGLVSTKTLDNLPTMTTEEFNHTFALEVEAGSIEKPNSENRKKEAANIIQMLGQFGTAAPKTVLGIVVRMIGSIFSKQLVTQKDLENLEQEGDAFMQKGISTNTQTQTQK